MKPKQSPNVFLPGNKMKESSKTRKFTPILKGNLAEHQYLTIMQASLTAIVKIY